MRITAAAKEETRQRILDTARGMFGGRGFEETTTRDIAREAGLATGTLFNYFDSKEEIVVALAHESMFKARDDFWRRRTEGASLEEDLFGNVAAQLRRLKPIRKVIVRALERTLHPAVAGKGEAELLRTGQLEMFGRILRQHGVDPDASPVLPSIYWSLYTGTLAFWAGDPSPQQEDSLAMLDQSTRMLVQWLKP